MFIPAFTFKVIHSLLNPFNFENFFQVDTMKRYFPVFDRLRKEFLAGEMIWTFADYNVLQCTYYILDDL